MKILRIVIIICFCLDQKLIRLMYICTKADPIKFKAVTMRPCIVCAYDPPDKLSAKRLHIDYYANEAKPSDWQ
jgi:hypothetical protein